MLNSAVKSENVKKCIRVGITIQIVIWGCKSSDLWSQIEFYGSADRSP